MLGKWYTKCNSADVNTLSLNESPVANCSSTCEMESATFCYCKSPESGAMIACDNKDCPIEWFHFDCIGIKNAPEGNWYCPECRPLVCARRKQSVV